ncbi:hypothetical protein E3P81_03318 [Wallemia ichthyophaga]|nr:hypothetical protein E3P97_03355 [Wallemia ichthyophaga]TIB29539.1 hypothetical protein E3P85_03131 [Wallemia ichthyophaga]TIB44846.1 hypothetical protein E3P82_03323 [Wallemia ichthyophaga]TIB47339.1 hypothetical protein E3P81_03318 [Wallemia ichthyophaga]TIB50430.1 hypothetical protein E3P80_03327 [Wallemia ichthyophaga]
MSNNLYSHSNSTDDEDDDTHLPSLLFHLPHDLVLHILTYLDPGSLIAVSLTNKSLHHTATDDAAWRRAFAFSFLGIQPSEENSKFTSIIASRISGRFSSWKEEFVRRSIYIRRWKKSKAPLITHNPRVATIHQISLDLSTITNPELTPRRLISVSLMHACLSRSEPFSGKLAKGYILAPGMAPNDASTVELSSDGRVIWGFASGFVGFTQIAKSALQHGSGAASAWGVRGSGLATHQNISRDFHYGPVTCLSHPSTTLSKSAWAAPSFVSGSMDGVVKLWSNEPELRCIWSSDVKKLLNSKGEELAHVDSVTQVAYDSTSCSIAAGYESGTVRVWSNMPIEACIREENPRDTIEEHRVAYTSLGSFTKYLPISKLLLDTQGPNDVSVLIYRKPETFFERHDIETKKKRIFGLGPISELTSFYLNNDLSKCSPLSTPILSRSASSTNNFSDALNIGSSFNTKDQILKHRRAVVAGDSSGRTCVWDWDARSDQVIEPLRIFGGHHSKITTISLTPLLLLTGAADGVLIAHDPLTGDAIRSFNQTSSTRHLSRYLATNEASTEDENAFAVSGIVADEFAVVAAIGNKVIAWKAGGIKDFKTRGKGWRGSNKGVAQKNQYSSDVRDEIRESLVMQDETDDVSESEADRKQNMMKTLGRLENLGLDESETLEYIMMISQEEEENQKKMREESEMEAILDEIKKSEDLEKQYEGDFPYEPIEGSSKQHIEDAINLEGDSDTNNLTKKEGKRSEYAPVAPQEEAIEEENPEPPSYSQVAENVDQNFEAQLEEAIKASLTNALITLNDMADVTKAEQLPNCKLMITGSSLSGKIELAKRVADLAGDKQRLRIQLSDPISNQHYFEHPHHKLFVIVVSCLEHMEDFTTQMKNIPQYLIARNLVYVVLSKSDLHLQHQMNPVEAKRWLMAYNADIPLMYWYSAKRSTDHIAKGILAYATRPLSSRSLLLYPAKPVFDGNAQVVGQDAKPTMGIISSRHHM